jgi:hypothetical protein
MSKLSFAECLARCREYGQEKTTEAQEKKKDQIRQQLAEKRKSYYQQMTTTVDELQLGKRPDIIHYSGLYYKEEKSHVQLQKLYGDMIQWVVDNKSQLLEETFPDVNVKVVDYNVNEKGNLVNIWFVLVRLLKHNFHQTGL